jgi:hypothetical protein
MTVKSESDRVSPALDSNATQSPRNSEDPYRHAISLDGVWTFQFGDETPHSITVPGPWESSRPDLRNRGGVAVYERTFTVPEEFAGRCVLLQFAAVDYFTEVWVNGTLIGKHEGGYTPFEFAIDHVLHGVGPDVPHTVLVRITDSTVDQDATLPNGEQLLFAEIPHGKQSWYSSVGGIWQSVSVLAVNQTHFTHAAITADIDAGRANLELAISSLPAAPGSDWQARVSVETPAGAVAIPSFTIPLDTDVTHSLENNLASLHAAFDVPDARLWSPDTPFLYRALITLEHDGEVVDVVSKRFGMRKIEAKEGRVWLNNQPIFLAGALDQAFYPRTIYTAPSTEFLRDQFVKAKEMGLNLMRCHIKVPSETYLDLCDEIGLLVWYELPNGARLSQAFRQRALDTMQQMWGRDAGHPCIVILTIINESWGIDLNNGEQRRWLANTYRWAKERFPTWLVVDNSACIPNFHVVSDLDDYHVYFNIPDQAEDFAEWVTAFIGREAGTFTGYGDAQYRRSEPLLISEFGNWGLPRVDGIIAAEGGEPYWFKTGDGATRPNRVLERFDAQRLNRVYRDYNELAAASQEQQWLSLKWEIEEMRRHPQVAGYVITEFTDINWECNGLLDMARNPKVFHHRLKDLQAQDILIPRLSPRTSFWENETAMLSVEFSCFSGRSVAGGMLTWEIEGFPDQRGELPVRVTGHQDLQPACGSFPVAQVWITAPQVTAPIKTMIHLALRDNRGEVIARTTQTIVFVPADRRTVGRGKTVWLYDPLHTAIGLSSLLTGIGCRVTSQPDPGALGLVTRWDPNVAGFLHNGGKAVLVATHAKSITIASGLGVRLLERNTNGWWGDWCTSKVWFVPDHFPSMPDTFRFDFEYQPIVPERVLTGPLPDNISSGLFVGWLHNPAAIVARLPIGNGDLVVTTFDLLPNLGSDPIATLLLHDLFSLPPAVRPD